MFGIFVVFFLLLIGFLDIKCDRIVTWSYDMDVYNESFLCHQSRDPLLLYYPVQRCPMHVTLKPPDTLAHVKPGDRGEGVGVVGLSSNNLTVLIWIVTLQGSIGVVTLRGHGQVPTFTADTITPWLTGAAPPGWDATVPVPVGPEWLRGSAMTKGTAVNALIPALHILPIIVVAGVRVPGYCKIVTRVFCSHSSFQ